MLHDLDDVVLQLMTAPDDGWRTVTSDHLSTVVPTPWPLHDLGDAGPSAVDAVARGAVPSIVITSRPSTASAAAASSEVMDQIVRSEPPAHLLACDVWASSGFPGRRIEFVDEAQDGSQFVTVWVFATGRHRVELRVAVDLADAGPLGPAVDAIGSRSQVHEPGMVERSWDEIADAEALDLEDVPEPRAEPRSHDALQLSAAARDLLLRRQAAHIGRPRSPQGRELREAGLSTPFGRTTAAAERLLQPMRGVRSVVRRRSATSRGMRVQWTAGDAALVDESSAPDLDALADAPHTLQSLTRGAARAELLRWYGVRPGFIIGASLAGVLVPTALLEQRLLTGEADVPDSGDEALRHAWSAPDWVEFRAEVDDARSQWRTLRAGDRRWYQVIAEGPDEERLLPLPSASLVAGLLEQLPG